MGSWELPISPVPREHPFRQGGLPAVRPRLRKNRREMPAGQREGAGIKSGELPLPPCWGASVPAGGAFYCVPSFERKQERNAGSPKGEGTAKSGALSCSPGLPLEPGSADPGETSQPPLPAAPFFQANAKGPGRSYVGLPGPCREWDRKKCGSAAARAAAKGATAPKRRPGGRRPGRSSPRGHSGPLSPGGRRRPAGGRWGGAGPGRG